MFMRGNHPPVRAYHHSSQHTRSFRAARKGRKATRKPEACIREHTGNSQPLLMANLRDLGIRSRLRSAKPKLDAIHTKSQQGERKDGEMDAGGAASTLQPNFDEIANSP